MFAFPIPSLVIYSEKSNKFYSFTINGSYICEDQNKESTVISPVVIRDACFCDYLVLFVLKNRFMEVITES